MVSAINIPPELNWVEKRAACSALKVFAELQNEIDEDVAAINAAKNLPLERQFKADMISGGTTVIVAQLDEYAPLQRVKIGVSDKWIYGEDQAVRKSWKASVGLNLAGSCVLYLDGEHPIERWQFRKMVLQQIFFWRRIGNMKTKPQSEEYKRFETLLGDVLSVPKAEITRRIEEDRRGKRTPKPSVSRDSAASAERED
jgi:hypothetical protein